MTVRLPTFEAHPRCGECLLGLAQIRRRGLPCRAWNGATGITKKTALLFVGAYPAAAEDHSGRVFDSSAGIHLNGTYIRGARLHLLADCYMTNAVRCFPRGRKSIDASEIRACRQYLVADIDELYRHYRTVVVVACGSEGISAVLGKSIAIGSFPQGRPVTIGSHKPVAFGTFNPANLNPGKDPSKIQTITEHLILIRRWLRTGRLHDPLVLPTKCWGKAVPDPPTDCGVLSLDIETYGAVATLPKQRCFQPIQSIKLDGCPPGQLVQTVALAWHTPAGIRAKTYRVQRHDDRRRFIATMRRVRPEAVLSNNVQFDITYLRTWPELRQIFDREHLTLYDLMCVSFLENDQREERSLKQLVVLLGIDDYYDEPVDLRKGERYQTYQDARLLRYNAKDAAATLACYEACCQGIVERYGANTPKWKATSRAYYNDELWLALSMSENGIAMDRRSLEDVRLRWQWRLDRMFNWGIDHDLLMSGPGMKTSQQSFVDEMVERYRPESPKAAGEFDRQLLLTDKKSEISTKDVNLTLIRGCIPRRTLDYRKVVRLQNYRTLFKLQTSYVHPLLGLSNDNVESQLVDGLVHPRWHIIPSKWSENSQRERKGGQRQARMSAQDPPVQTQPKVIRAAQRSRFRGGARLWCDLSQIELRVPVIYCGDPVMLGLFRAGKSLHAMTASDLAGRPITKKSNYAWYDAGKHVNFLRVYGGDAPKLQSTVLLLTHESLPLGRCKEWLASDKRKYPVFYAWQESLYDLAIKQHRLELPVVGISRAFCGDVRRSYYSEVLSFPVQGMAATLCESAQAAIDRELVRQGARTLTNENIHDSSGYDVPADEIDDVKSLVLRYFRHPPILDQLLDAGYFDCPLDAEVEIVYNAER